ncbi:helix-turn-helix domain-containing protein [Schleiferilactobacillus harbinensis]|jgi:transcriptional regulator with XRE-family HTH domain|uniref:helix-turn-helix domain-containing protein n=1 Tax=Schleiferilactobacillus harbinensis TaxID=304207 RepID=UPI002670D269|nr:helix-turn-helix transcriptional regulator [Schleiferilactobacillus harbinensis]
MTTFGERLKQRRQSLKITQAQLAELLSVSRSAISNWEVGRNYPDLDILVPLSEILQISVDQLLKEEPEMVEELGKEQRLNRKRKIALRIIVPAFAVMICLSLYLLFHNTETVYRTISPDQSTVLTISQQTSTHWHTASWNGSSVIKPSIFKASYVLTNDDGSQGNIKLRFVSLNGKTMQTPFMLKAGKSHKVALKNRNQRFRIQVKAKSGQYVINLQ